MVKNIFYWKSDKIGREIESTDIHNYDDHHHVPPFSWLYVNLNLATS